MENIQQQYQKVTYLKGFGNTFASQALPGVLPHGQNSPIKLKHGVYAQQLSGTAFTVKRADNQKVWYYKIRPSVVEGQYQKSQYPYRIVPNYISNQHIQNTPNQLRWRQIPSVKEGEKVNFIEGLVSLMGAGEPSLKHGMAIYAYSANVSMTKTAFYNSDGDFLIVPHKGTLFVKTLNGKLIVKPKEILIIPRGVKFSIDVDEEVKGWATELYGQHLSLPQLGVIGSNGLANPVDFEYPTAWFENRKEEWKLVNKYIGQIFEAKTPYNPFDVVAWRGNYSPCKYNLELYNTIGSISFDHPDPSIFTVLTAKSNMQGTAALDFVIFPPRWLAMEHTFKPPYYHRNCMTQFMGNISGQYDAKGKGFAPGCSSLHSTMTPHGPDAQSYEKAVNAQQKPFKTPSDSISFMFESGYMLKTTKYAMKQFAQIDTQYHKSWERLGSIKFQA